MADQSNLPGLGRCSTCRHWETIDLDDDPYEIRLLDEQGNQVYADEDYTPAKPPGQWGWCKRVAEFGPEKASRFYVVDGSQYMAKLGTRDDFGCVEHEPSDSDDNPAAPS